MRRPRFAARLPATVFPGAAIGVVLAVALTLIVQVTLRPWANANTGFDTHLNFSPPDQEYNRTILAAVNRPRGAPEGWEPISTAPDADPALVDYVGFGCASCHGIEGQGTASGPPIAGSSARRVMTLVRQGPGGMPAYTPIHLSDKQLEGIAGFVSGLPEAPQQVVAVVAATATPFPTSTPMPEPTGTPAPTPMPTPTALPAGAPTPSPEPTPTLGPAPTSTPTPDPVRLQAAQSLMIDVGCDLCHGLKGTGTDGGPRITGLSSDEMHESVRYPVSDPKSKYPKGMPAYSLKDVSDEELDEIIYFLMNLPD